MEKRKLCPQLFFERFLVVYDIWESTVFCYVKSFVDATFNADMCNDVIKVFHDMREHIPKELLSVIHYYMYVVHVLHDQMPVVIDNLLHRYLTVRKFMCNTCGECVACDAGRMFPLSKLAGLVESERDMVTFLIVLENHILGTG